MTTKKKILLLCLAFTLLVSIILCRYFYTGNVNILDGGFSGTVTCIDGCFAYFLSTTLVDADGNPLKNVKVMAFDNEKTEPNDIKTSRPEFFVTDLNGYVELTVYSGLTWGGVYRPGVELPPRPSVPQNPKVLYLWHKDRDGQWQQTEIKVEDDNIKKAKRGELYIHIDKIRPKQSVNHSPLGRK